MNRDAENKPAAGEGEAADLGRRAASDMDDSLAMMVVTHLQEQAWSHGSVRTGVRRGVSTTGPAAWDESRPRSGSSTSLYDPSDHPDYDRGPGLAPGRDRPGPTRFDPRTGKRELEKAVAERGWAGKLAMAQIVVGWEQIVGAQVAEHATITAFEEGRLDIRASSSAWAQQLRLMLPSIHGAVERELARLSPTGKASAVEIRIFGPSGPTWKKGRFGAARGGRGPRDTYG